MINFDRITGFQWDQGNARKSADKHGVTQAEAEQVLSTAPSYSAEILNTVNLSHDFMPSA